MATTDRESSTGRVLPVNTKHLYSICTMLDQPGLMLYTCYTCFVFWDYQPIEYYLSEPDNLPNASPLKP